MAALHLAEVEVSDDEDVLDPAGHEGDFYAACADQLWGLCQLVAMLYSAIAWARPVPVGMNGATAPCSRPLLRVAQSACTERRAGPGEVGHARAKPLGLLVGLGGVSGRCAMKRRLAPSAMPTIP